MTNWQVAQGTLIGPYHRRMGTVNQDAYGSLNRDDLTVLVAADGAGSLELSHIGSRLAVDTLLSFMEQADLSLDLTDLLQDAVEHTRATLLAHPDRALIGCTLAAVAVTADAHAVAVVGDAFAVLRYVDGELALFTSEAESEYANVTQFITSERCDLIIAGEQETLAAAAVASDGLDNVAIQAGEPFEQFWTPVFTYAQNAAFEVTDLLAHMDQQDKIEDDTTLVVGVRNG